METTTVRLDNELVKQAKQAEKTTKRKASKQIEHWAEIGKKLEEKLNSSEIEAVLQGKAKIQTEKPENLNMSQVIYELENDRASGKLARDIRVGKEWFEASRDIPGHLVRISEDGTREIGNFVDGKFVVGAKAKSKK
jgi:hypothetical protein